MGCNKYPYERPGGQVPAKYIVTTDRGDVSYRYTEESKDEEVQRQLDNPYIKMVYVYELKEKRYNK